MVGLVASEKEEDRPCRPCACTCAPREGRVSIWLGGGYLQIREGGPTKK